MLIKLLRTGQPVLNICWLQNALPLGLPTFLIGVVFLGDFTVTLTCPMLFLQYFQEIISATLNQSQNMFLTYFDLHLVLDPFPAGS